jgi:hypothetical protein
MHERHMIIYIYILKDNYLKDEFRKVEWSFT